MRAAVNLAVPMLLAAQGWTPEKEALVGASMAAGQQNRMIAVESDSAREYLAAITNRFRTALPADTPALQITVVANEPDGPLPYPAAFPGGYLIVPARMLVDAPDEASFARKLAHAAAHIAQRHGLRTFRRGTIADGTPIPLLFISGMDGPPRLKVLIPAAMREMHEQWEHESEDTGGRIMERFSPDARFARVQAEMRALKPAPKVPSLRRPGEAKPQ